MSNQDYYVVVRLRLNSLCDSNDLAYYDDDPKKLLINLLEDESLFGMVEEEVVVLDVYPVDDEEMGGEE